MMLTTMEMPTVQQLMLHALTVHGNSTRCTHGMCFGGTLTSLLFGSMSSSNAFSYTVNII